MERHGWLALETDSNCDTHGCTGTYQLRYTSYNLANDNYCSAAEVLGMAKMR